MIPKCAKCGKELRDCIYWLDGDKVCRDCYTKEYLVAIHDSVEPKLDRQICPKCNTQISEEGWQVDNPKLSWFDLRCPTCENLVNIVELDIANTKDLKEV